MPILIPLPADLSIPQEPQFELPAIFELAENGMLSLLAVDGIPVSDMAEEAAEETPAPQEPSFAQAVEQRMQ